MTMVPQKLSGLLTLVVFISCFGLACSDLGQEVKPNGDNEYKYFGACLEGDNFPITLPLKNDYSQDMSIAVKDSCACAKSEKYKQSLKPGEATDIKVALSTAGLHGLIKKKVFIKTNLTARPVIDLGYSVYVVPREVLAVNDININALTPGKKQTATINAELLYKADELKFNYNKDTVESVKIAEWHKIDNQMAKSMAPELEREYTQKNKVDRVAVKLAVTFSGCKYGKSQGRISLVPASNKTRPIDIKYCLNVGGDIKFDPEYLNFGEVKQGAGKRLCLKLINKKGAAVPDVSFENRGLPLEIKEHKAPGTGSEKSFDVLLSLPASTRYSSDLFGSVLVKVGGREPINYPLRVICHPLL